MLDNCTHKETFKNFEKIADCLDLSKIKWLKHKYGRVKDKFKLPDEICEYSECDMFKNNPSMVQEEPSGPVVVCGEGEELKMEW